MVRKRMKDLLASMEPGEADEGSRLASARLLTLPEYAKADIVLAFLSKGGEIGTEEIIRNALNDGKRVAVPRMERSAENEPYLVFVPLQADYRDWPRDSFGIPEPPATLEALSESDLGRASVFVVTPGLAFDRSGGRLGRGRGYYDRFLSSARASAARRGASVFACGLCYAAQVLDELPRNEFDVPVDLIVTEEGLIGR